jgi:hypothetical protein
MQSENLTIESQAHNRLRLVNTSHRPMSDQTNAPAQSAQPESITRTDPRWLFAARVQVMLSGARTPSIGLLEDLVDTAQRGGFSDMHSRAMIAIVEESQIRNGLDSIAMQELLQIPLPIQSEEPVLSVRARWMTFGVLFAWSLMIAGLMQLV